MIDISSLLATEPEGQLTTGDAALFIRMRDALRELADEAKYHREQRAEARLAATALHDRIMEMAHDPQSAARAFAVGQALRRLDDAIAERAPGDGYCPCGERLDKPHQHGGV